MTQNTFIFLNSKGTETVLSAYIQPKASKNELAGVFQDRLKIRICAPPVEGEANKEVVSFLAKLFDVSKSEIKLLRGEQSRQKTFLIPKPVDFIVQKLLGAGFGK